MLQRRNPRRPEAVDAEAAAEVVEAWARGERQSSPLLLEGWTCPFTCVDSGRPQPTTPSSSGAAWTANSSMSHFVKVSSFSKAICSPKSTNVLSKFNVPKPKDKWLETR